jgi:hypothetical protein
MVCEHLQALDEELTAAGIDVIYRDRQPWSRNCRAWTRYACYLDLAAIRERLQLADCVVDHLYNNPWMGEERGFDCNEHHDAIIGDYEQRSGRPVIR